MDAQHHRSRIAVVGAGAVGSSFAYALSIKGLVREVALIDQDGRRAEGEAMDLSHGLALTAPMEIEAGGYDLCAGAHVVAITAGAAQKPGETRLDLIRKNASIMRSIVAEILRHNPSPIILVVSNPVDVLTRIALAESGLPPGRVLGSGTVLDSARFRYLLSQHCRVDPRSIHAQIAGEHGDSEFALWSRVNIGGVPMGEYCPMCGKGCEPSFRERIVDQVRRAAYEIIARKGATNYAIGLSMSRIVEAIVRDQRSVLTVSSLADGIPGAEGVCLSLPSIVGAGGVEQVLGAALAGDEAEGLRRSAGVLRQALGSVGY